MEKLTSNRLKWIKTLHLKKNRQEEKCFIIEGKKIVEEVFNFKKEYIKNIYISEKEYIGFFSNAIIISKKEMEKISTLKTPPGILAICSTNINVSAKSPLTLLLDKIKDPGNLGTIIRTASWFGVDHIICSEDSVDCFNPKVVQSSMGAIFDVKVEYKDLLLINKNKKVYGTFIDSNNFNTKNIDTCCYLLMGSESDGISKELEGIIDERISIPRKGTCDSLNLSVATGIFLNYFTNKN